MAIRVAMLNRLLLNGLAHLADAVALQGDASRTPRASSTQRRGLASASGFPAVRAFIQPRWRSTEGNGPP